MTIIKKVTNEFTHSEHQLVLQGQQATSHLCKALPLKWSTILQQNIWGTNKFK